MVINPIVGAYIPIIRIPIKGGMTIPNIATFDHGTCRCWILGLPPTQDSSHHQDYYIFRIGNPDLNLHLPLASWVGGRSKLDLNLIKSKQMLGKETDGERIKCWSHDRVLRFRNIASDTGNGPPKTVSGSKFPRSHIIPKYN